MNENGPPAAEAAWVRIPSGGGSMNGLWWPARTPPGGEPDCSAVYLHGRVLDMFTALGPAAARSISRRGMPALLFDRRGRHLATAVEGPEIGGGAHHSMADHEEDVAAGVGWVLARGARKVLLIGHSQGGLLAARYAAVNPGEVQALLLASPIPRYAPITASSLGAGWGLKAKREAERLVAEGRGEDPILMDKWVFIIKARLALEDHPAREADALEKALSRVRCPLYYTVGTEGVDRNFSKAGLRAARASAASPKRIRVREGGDHLYARDAEAVLTDMLGFLEKTGTVPRGAPPTP